MEISDCCCAFIVKGDICSECLEHCEPIAEQLELENIMVNNKNYYQSELPAKFNSHI